MTRDRPVRVLVAGGGIAAAELVLALRSRAGVELDITLVAPNPELLYRPESIFEPFSFAARRYPLPALAAALEVTLLPGRVSAVEKDRRVVHVDGERTLEYDELVVATGAGTSPAVEGATTLRAEDADALHWIVSELEDESAGHVVLAAGRSSGWTLPIYELALLLAGRARDAGLKDRVTVVTYEATPLQVFSGPGTAAVEELLRDAGVRLVCGPQRVRRIPHALRIEPNGPELPADRVLALPALHGPGIRGLPLDADGFIRVGPALDVPGAPGVQVIGDAAAMPVKQGGLATQHADVVAGRLLERAGIRSDLPSKLHSWLRATLVTGERTSERLYLAGPLIGGEVVSPQVTHHPPAWATQKIASTHLAPFLTAVDADGLDSAATAVAVRRARNATTT